jgi:high-affinity iron transporter
MYNIILIVFRETLEAALFVGIVAAAISGVDTRKKTLGLGIGLGIVGSIVLASLSGYLAQALDGLGQDVAQATILGSAALMLGWHCITSQVHGKSASKEASQLGKKLASNGVASRLIVAALALTVLREGAETVLFVMGVNADAQSAVRGVQLWGAVALGISAGCAGCYAMFSGLKAFSVKTMFKVTHLLLIVFIGAMASRLAKLMISAGWLDTLSSSAWDTEALLPSKSGIGLVLNALVGYDSQPALLQLLSYVMAIVLVLVLTKQYTARHIKNSVTRQEHLNNTRMSRPK